MGGPGGCLECWELQGSRPELCLSLQASRYRSRRNTLSPLPSVSDTMWTGGLGLGSSHHWSPNRGPRQPRNAGIRVTWSPSVGKEAWASSSSKACPGALRWSWDKPVDRGDGWRPQAAPRQGSGSPMRPSLRRPSLGDPPVEGDGQKWPRESPVWSGRGAKDHSPGKVPWAHL